MMTAPERRGSVGPMRASPSGEQYELRLGAQRAVVTEVGATLGHYSLGGIDVVDGFGPDERSTAGRGQVLAPWPNRLDDGRYVFEGRQAQAALDEPEHRNAIHGLVRWLPWTPVTRTEASVDLRCALFEQPGYPWNLELAVGYRLEPAGLVVTAQATNPGDTPVPFGIGFHPYLSVAAPVDGAVLRLPAARRLVTDERGLPTGDEAVEGSEFDFRDPRAIGPIHLDAGFTDLAHGPDGRTRAELSHPGTGRSVTLWVDPGFGYLMVYTGDLVEPSHRRRRSVAIEPMTCPPDAFRSGTDVLRLEPADAWSASWGILPHGGSESPPV
jgi:aldose 1-epimerase